MCSTRLCSSANLNVLAIRQRQLGPLLAVAVAAATLLASVASAQPVAVSLSGSTYLQNFNAMVSSTSAAFTSSVPQGWGIFRSGTSTATPAFSSGSTSTVTTQEAGSAGNTPTTGAAYLWVDGSLASGTDKAIGFLSSSSYPGPSNTSTSSSLAILFGFTNNTGGTITDLNLSWNYEKYRSGTRAWDWTFFTSTDGSTWSSATLGDQAYAADATNTVMSNPPTASSKSVSLSALNIADASSYYLRWSYAGVGGFSNGQGLGLDDFNMAATYTSAALDLYWNGGSGWGSTAPGVGGVGTWADGTGSWNSSMTANFDGSAGAVSAGAVTAGRGMKFNTTGYTLSGGTIALNGGSITTGTDSSVTATVNSKIAGSNGLTKAGGGTLVLGGANTFTGNVSVNAGTLQVAADSALGDASNDLRLAGTLKTTTSIAMGSDRDVTGAGTLDIAPGTKLTSSGSFNLSTTTLASSGTLDLQGATRSVGVLSFGTAAWIDGSGAISLNSISAAAVTTGTAVINPAIAFTSNGDKAVVVGSGGTLAINGDIAGTTGRILKTGAGTLVIGGANTTSGFTIGSAGASPTNGGTVVFAPTAGSGTGQLRFNYGTLVTTIPGGMTFANGVSIGGRTGAVAVIDGSQPITFGGTSSFFRSFDTSGEFRLDVNNTTTISGVLGASSFSGSSTGVTIGGTGRLILAANGLGASGSTSFTERVTVNSGATLEIANETALAAAPLNTSGGGTITFGVPAATVASIQGTGTLALKSTSNAPIVLTLSQTTSGTYAGGFSGPGSVIKNGDSTLALTGVSTHTGTTAVQQGVLQVGSVSALGASTLAVANSATASVASYIVAGAGGLDLAANGLVDLTAGGLTIGNASAVDIVARIKEGRGDGSWTGTSGITSSVAASDVTSGIPRAVGWLDNGDGSVIAAFAAPGDTNLDWVVDVLDASNFLSFGKYNTSLPATWLEGDFNYDGVVDALDAAEFSSTGLYNTGNYNTPAGIAGAVAAVPEPSLATAGLLAVGASLLLARRRRSRV